ncbi:DUF4244 domain-containing protein [Pseudonocardia sp. CA-107938]|uniref:DUF4244 domain-containing protein n=1 Tax=Pseudonocardia sp. CA-107938 TaxID=3240021 RepID=UPI003D944200
MTTIPAPILERRRRRHPLSHRLRGLATDDSGMSTVEYAIGTIAAAAFAAILYAVVSGDSIVGALTTLIQRALTATF